MYKLAIIFASLAFSSAAPGYVAPLATPFATPLGAALPATLLPKVAVAPAETTIVKQPVVIQQAEPVLRSVPVPVRAVAYAPQPIISAPVAYAAPLSHVAPLTYSYPFAAPYAAPAILK